MCDSKQKSSYKHVSDFGRLRSYDRFFNSRTRPRVNHISQLAGSRTPLAYLETFVECVKVEGGGWYSPGARAVHNRAAACFAAGGGIFENQF